MNLDDRNIDQLFRDAAQNKPAPNYSSAYWNDISSALDAEKAKRKGFILWSLGGGMALSLIFVALFTNQGVNSPEALYTYGHSGEVSIVEHQKSKVDLSENSSLSNTSFIVNSIQRTNDDGILAEVNTDRPENLANSKQYQNKIKFKERVVEIPNESSKALIFANKEIYPINSLAPKVDRLLSSKGPCFIEGKERKWNLTAELSAGIMENYETSRPFQSGIMNLALKARYQKDGVLFSTGLGVQASTNADLVVSRRAKFYGFGVVNHQTDLSYENMYDVYIPVEIGYRQNKTSFGMGLQANYLVNTSMQLQSFEDNQLVSTEQITGYSNGLNKISGQGYIWLSQQLSPRLSAGIKIGTTFTNRIKEGDYFNESSTTNPVFGQVSLHYNIFK